MAVGQPQLNPHSRQSFVRLGIEYIILDLLSSTQPPTEEAVAKYKTKAKKDLKDLPSEIWMRIKKEGGNTEPILPPSLETLQNDTQVFFEKMGAKDRLSILQLQDSECLVSANTQQGQEPGSEGGEVDADLIVTLAVWLRKNKIWPDFGNQEVVTQAMLWKLVGKAESQLGVVFLFQAPDHVVDVGKARQNSLIGYLR